MPFEKQLVRVLGFDSDMLRGLEFTQYKPEAAVALSGRAHGLEFWPVFACLCCCGTFAVNI